MSIVTPSSFLTFAHVAQVYEIFTDTVCASAFKGTKEINTPATATVDSIRFISEKFPVLVWSTLLAEADGVLIGVLDFDVLRCHI